MDTGYPALIAELPNKENDLKIPAHSQNPESKNLPATKSIPEKTISPPTINMHS